MRDWVYESELRVNQQGPGAFSVECYAIRQSESVLVGEGFGCTEDEALEDAVEWMNTVGRLAPRFYSVEPEYHQAPLLGRKFGVLMVASVFCFAVGCAAIANYGAPTIPPAPEAPAVAEVDVPQQSLDQIRESMKVLSNPGDEELARQFTVLRLLKDPCGIPKAMVAYAQHKDEWAAGHAVYDYLEAFSEEDKYKAVQNHPMVGVSEDYLFSLMEQ